MAKSFALMEAWPEFDFYSCCYFYFFLSFVLLVLLEVFKAQKFCTSFKNIEGHPYGTAFAYFFKHKSEKKLALFLHDQVLSLF